MIDWSDCDEVERFTNNLSHWVLRGTSISPELILNTWLGGESTATIARRLEGWTPTRVQCVLDFARAQDSGLFGQNRPQLVDWFDCNDVEQISGKVSGAPILKGTRVTADQIADSYGSGCSPAEIAFAYDLDERQVQRVIAFAQSQS